MKDRKTELLEAKHAARRALNLIRDAQRQLSSARNWGVVDIFGGGLLTGIVKRDRISEAHTTLRRLDRALEDLRRELRDVQLNIPEGPSDTGYDLLVDLVFDNIITDLRVQDEIKGTLSQLEILAHKVTKIEFQLDDELGRLGS
ncbi:MAG: hypothetical protein QM296_01065 [Bacillota bacterium]|nr:hypothetical protein [Bacillota bacterium]